MLFYGMGVATGLLAWFAHGKITEARHIGRLVDLNRHAR